MRVRFLSGAVNDLEQIRRYIAADNPIAAERVVARIKQQIEKLAKNPYLGAPGREPGTRRVVVTGLPYVAVYEIEGKEVLILGIFHGARNWSAKRRSQN